MALIDDLRKILEVGKLGLTAGSTRDQFRELISRDRDAACEAIAQALRDQTPAQWRSYELWFLTQGTMEIHPVRRIRAMELYAFIKLLERELFGASAGFHTVSDPIG